jgi:catechol 2,3-dioxygenase-like lactoylglutathione lyase family enzyme
MKNFLLFSIIFSLISILPLCGQTSSDVKRPSITGVAHAAYYVKNIDQARSFYKDFLGYSEPLALKMNGSEEIALIFIKINDRQFIEIFPEKTSESERFYHYAIETDDAEGMRQYLSSRGIKVPEKTPVGRTGNLNYFVKDPNGIICEIVQYSPDGFTSKNRGKDLPATRVSRYMSHVGIMVSNLDSAMKFYRDVLGFKETWRGSSNGTMLSWVNMKVPDGNDYIELMLFDKMPDQNRKGSMNHICLVVDDASASGKILQSRKLPEICKTPSELKTGINRKRQINYFDPDGTRVEIMEPFTIDGLAVPSSSAPAPKYKKTDF